MATATFTWKPSGIGDWANSKNWQPTGVPGIISTGATDVANLSTSGGVNTFTATVEAGETFSLDTVNLSSSGSHTAGLTVAGQGTLVTNTLSLSGAAAGDITNVDNSGVLNIVTTITATVAEIVDIQATGSTGGGRLEFGSATHSGMGVNSTNVTFNFSDNSSGFENDGLVEYLSGYGTGPGQTTTTNQIFTNIAWGDGFIFDGANFSGDTVTLNNHVLTAVNNGITVLTMNNVTAAVGTTFAGVGNEIVAVCYARGTMLRTPDGELAVEKLRAGKQVITLVDGQEVPKTVTWLGQRRINIAGHRPETVAPIRIRRDAFAEGVPHRDLIVSPDHAIFVDGMLICARQLVNGSTIRQELDWTAVDYYHVQLESHAILLAEGLPAESYIDTGNSGFFENSDAPLVLHPDLTDETDYPTREAGSCAPFVWDEASVRPVWQRLVDRAATIGQPIPQPAVTTEPNLRIRGKMRERQSKPIHADSKLAIFVLPRGLTQVHLLSHAQSPTEARPWLEDRRRLGVRVQRIVLRGANELREIPMDHPDLIKGWWDIERDGQMMSRWTDGDAVIALPKMDGHVMLEVHLAGEMIYALEAERESQAA